MTRHEPPPPPRLVPHTTGNEKLPEPPRRACGPLSSPDGYLPQIARIAAKVGTSPSPQSAGHPKTHCSRQFTKLKQLVGSSSSTDCAYVRYPPHDGRSMECLAGRQYKKSTIGSIVVTASTRAAFDIVQRSIDRSIQRGERQSTTTRSSIDNVFCKAVLVPSHVIVNKDVLPILLRSRMAASTAVAATRQRNALVCLLDPQTLLLP